MLFQIKSYLKFLWRSKNEHAVHSPFVFSLVTKCFYDYRSKPEYSILKKYQKSLLENKNLIEVTDFDACFKVFKSNKNQIAKNATTSKISSKRTELLYRVAHYFEPHKILEVGTSFGLVTSALAFGAPKAKVITIGSCSQRADVTKNQLQKFGCNNVENIVSEFSNYLSLIARNSELTSFNLIYFDRNHSKKVTLEYFELLLSTIDNDSVWIFDGIHCSTEREETWETIKNHPKVKITIDIFQMGFVFFRREQCKEHFIIRY